MHAKKIASGTAPTTAWTGSAETGQFREPQPAIQPEPQYAATA